MGGRKNEHTWPEKNLSTNEESRERFNTYLSFSLLDQKPSEISGPAHILHLISYRKKHGVSDWVRDLVLSGACHCCEKGFTFSSSRVGWTISSLQPLSPQEGKDGVFEINLVEFGQSGSLQGLCPEAQQGMVQRKEDSFATFLPASLRRVRTMSRPSFTASFKLSKGSL